MIGPATYGESIADIYDDLYSGVSAETLDVLVEMAGGGRALELGIGTGRVALPLIQRGVEVHGIDASPAMVERMRRKPRGADVPVVTGDFADAGTLVRGPFTLAFATFNTFFALLTQEQQLACFAGVAKVLGPRGRFVLEVFVPDVTRFASAQPAFVGGFDDTSVILDVSRHDAARQRVSTRAVRITEQGTRIVPIEIRYAWPSELDLMARLAGMRLLHRWAGWRREPFTSASGAQVAVYEKV